VLDSSLSLAWCFEDEQTPSVMALLDRITETGASALLLWLRTTRQLLNRRTPRLFAANMAAASEAVCSLPTRVVMSTALANEFCIDRGTSGMDTDMSRSNSSLRVPCAALLTRESRDECRHCRHQRNQIPVTGPWGIRAFIS